MLFTKEVGIDLGTANTLIYVKGEGIVLNEPSVVSLDAETKKCLAVGQDAKEMLGRTPGRVSAIRPLKDGVIADFEVTELMLEHFIRKLKLKGMFSRPTILICCPSNITSVERNAIRDAAYRCGAKRVYIEEEPKVAAIGAGLDIAKPTGSMVLDIGGGSIQMSLFDKDKLSATQNMRLGVLRLQEKMSRLNVRPSENGPLLEELLEAQLSVFRKMYLKDRVIENIIVVDDYISALILGKLGKVA